MHPEAFRVGIMIAPSSLPADIVARAFVAKNGELGIAPKDTEAFLQACEQHGVAVLGWEAWIINHRWDFDLRRPLPANGSWCGLFPTLSDGAVIGAAAGGIGNADAARRDIAAFALDPEWREFIRFNFTLE